MDDLHLLKDLIEELERISITTTQGAYVKMEDVKRLAKKREEAKEVTKALPAPKTMAQAKEQAKEFLKTQNLPGAGQVPEPGKAVPAREPQPSSRT